MPRRLTTAEFIEKAKAVHGDRYDYSKTEYVNRRTRVSIVCPTHGPFAQNPSDHMNGSGCPDCAISTRQQKRRLSTQQFVEKAQAVHGDQYDYSRTSYTNWRSDVEIVCPSHGPFFQKPSSHIRQAAGCPECSGKKQLTTGVFIDRAKSVHGNRYDYSQAQYVNASTPVRIVCPDHGPFEQIAGNHINQKHGCPKCGGTERLTTDRFIEKAKLIHGDRYDYSRVKYVNSKTDVTIVCPDHGPFRQKPNNHLVSSRNVGCPDCAAFGFNPSEPGILYYVAVATADGDTRYKIGITNSTVKDRFLALDLARIRIVKTWHYAIGRAAAEREAEILRQYAGDRYYGPPILHSGNTELFTHDVLGLDE